MVPPSLRNDSSNSSAVTKKRDLQSSKDGATFIAKRLSEMKEEVVKEKDFPAKDKPIADELVTHLGKLLLDKKALDKAFGSQEKAEKWADDRKLTSDQKRIMVAMQKHKEIYRHNALLDNVMTVLFLLQVSAIGLEMWNRGMFGIFLIMCIIIDALVYRVKSVSEWLGTVLSDKVFADGMGDEKPLAGRIQMKKWQEQSWQLAVHVSMSILEFCILSDEEWWSKPETSWVPHPFEQRGKFRTDLQVFYIAQLGIWIYTCYIHRFVDERRKDYYVMYMHHIVTIALVGLSWAVGYMRIGVLVLFIHDVSDIFVDLLKMVNYLKLEGQKGFFLSEIAYVVCVLSWIYFRLYQFPFRIFRGSFLTPYVLLLRTPRVSYSFLGLEFFPSDLPWHFHLNVMLMALMVLHVYWFFLFLRIGLRIMNDSARDASRLEYEGDSDDGGDKED